MEKRTNKGTGRKRPRPGDTVFARAVAAALWRFPHMGDAHIADAHIDYIEGYLAGWRAAKREGKR